MAAASTTSMFFAWRSSRRFDTSCRIAKFASNLRILRSYAYSASFEVFLSSVRATFALSLFLTFNYIANSSSLLIKALVLNTVDISTYFLLRKNFVFFARSSMCSKDCLSIILKATFCLVLLIFCVR